MTGCLQRCHGTEEAPGEPGWRGQTHLGIAASDLDDPVADGQKQFESTVGIPGLRLHHGLAQGQPHVSGQEVLTVLSRGPTSQNVLSAAGTAMGGPTPPSAGVSVKCPAQGTQQVLRWGVVSEK